VRNKRVHSIYAVAHKNLWESPHLQNPEILHTRHQWSWPPCRVSCRLNWRIQYTLYTQHWCVVCKKTCKYFLQFSIDIQQNVEWTRFLAHPVCVYSNDNEGGIKKCKIQIRLSLGKFKRPLWYIYRLFNVFPLNLASIQKSPQTHGYSSQSHTHPISIPMGMGIPIPTAALPTILVSTQPHPQQDRSE